MKFQKLGRLKLAVKSERRDQAFEAGQTDKTSAGDARTLSRMILIYNNNGIQPGILKSDAGGSVWSVSCNWF